MKTGARKIRRSTRSNRRNNRHTKDVYYSCSGSEAQENLGPEPWALEGMAAHLGAFP